MEKDCGVILGEQIALLRRQSGLTQEALAGKLGLSFQAVSKWENGVSCPDVALLPAIADIFNTSVDGLFRRTPAEKTMQEKEESFSFLPWEDDGVLRAAAFVGRKLLVEGEEEMKKINVFYEGTAADVVSYLHLTINGDVGGDVSAGGDLTVDGDVNGDANVGGDLTMGGDVSGDISTGK